MTPKRIQRHRTKGWRMPDGTIYVGRPTLFGNPWALRDARNFDVPLADRAAWVIAKYRHELTSLGLLSDWGGMVAERRWEAVARLDLPTMADYARRLLRGHDLACWCLLDQPCHADVLLEVANG